MLRIYSYSEINQRTKNEDALEFKKIPFSGCSEDMWALVVADGMGGGAAGEVYSRLTVSETITALEEIASDTERGRSQNPADAARGLLPLLETAVARINRRVISAAGVMDIRGGGSTLAAALVIGQCLVTFNVGDSPVYLLSGGSASELSVRDNQAEELFREGDIARNSEAYARGAGTLTAFIGDRRDPDPHPTFSLLSDGDAVILGTDGAFGDMTAAEDVAALLKGLSPSAYADSLCSAAAASTFDNQTVIVADYAADRRSLFERLRNRHSLTGR